MAISKEDIKKKVNTTPVVTQSVKQSMEQPQSQELQSVLKRTVQQQPVVTNNIRQQVEGTTPSTPQSQELQSIQDRTEQQMAKQKVMQTPVATEQIKQAVESTRQPATTTTGAPTTTVSKYADMMAKLQDPTPTAEELEAERKRERRKAIFNAIGDGVSSLANLYFTTKGAPNSYNPADNMTRKQLERYEKMLDDRKKDQEQYFNQYLRLSQLDENANWRKQQVEYQKQRDNVNDARYKEQQEQRAEQIKTQAKQWKAQFDYQKEKDAADRDVRIAQNDANNRYRAATLAETQRYHDIVAGNKDKATASKLRGKELVFSDGNKHQFKIYENVWKASMPQVLDVLLKDPAVLKDPQAKMTATMISNGMLTSSSAIDNFVKQNYGKSLTAVKMMEAFSKYDPAAPMSSQVESEEIVDYNPEEEIIDWNPEN